MSAAGLNIALTDLRSASVRQLALADLEHYLADYDLTPEDVRAVLDLDWPTLFAHGASPYTMNKLRHINRLEHDDLGPCWRHESREELERFLHEQNARNAAYALPVEETL